MATQGGCRAIYYLSILNQAWEIFKNLAGFREKYFRNPEKTQDIWFLRKNAIFHHSRDFQGKIILVSGLLLFRACAWELYDLRRLNVRLRNKD